MVAKAGFSVFVISIQNQIAGIRFLTLKVVKYIIAGYIHSCHLISEGVYLPSDRTVAVFFVLSGSGLFASNTYKEHQYGTLS